MFLSAAHPLRVRVPSAGEGTKQPPPEWVTAVLARPKGLEPPTFRTGSRNMKMGTSVEALSVHGLPEVAVSSLLSSLTSF